MGTWKNKLWTFLIGLVAGAAPFLCMSYVPHLLDPRTAVTRLDLGALIAVGILVGFVTLIMDARRFAEEDPREILMRSLAIPSILLATVTGLQSRGIVNEQRTDAIARVDSTWTDVNIVPAPAPIEEVQTPPQGGQPIGWLWLPSAAQAQTPPKPQVTKPHVATTPTYLVTLGTYSTARAAEQAADRWRRTNALATERYYQKSVRVFGSGPQVFYVVYTTPLPRGEAIKLYKLLRINDPTVPPQVVQIAAR